MCFSFLGHIHRMSQVSRFFPSTRPVFSDVFKVIFLLGHWNHEGLGCGKQMSVPEIRAALLQIPGCSGFGRRRPKQDLNVLKRVSPAVNKQHTKRNWQCLKMMVPQNGWFIRENPIKMG